MKAKTVKAWGVKDCTFKSIRAVSFCKEDLIKENGCKKCKIIRVEIKEIKYGR